MIFDPHIAVAGVVTLSIGWFMTTVGVHKNALEWKRRRRICPSCGRTITGGSCTCVG
jgi:hypothetical protein